MQKMQYALNGYQILEKLYDGAQTLVYRGQRKADQQSVIVKTIKNPYPTLTELSRLRHQYTILQRLDLPGVPKAYSLEQSQKGLALILEDCGGISLNEFIETQISQNKSQKHSSANINIAQCISLPIFFSIALQLAQTLDGLYRHKVTHKDIKPENILIHPKTLDIKLIDFSIASCLTRETQSVQHPDLLEGTLAYMSPEQTGRMNRGIDYRTDFYSLGITFYKLLTGQLPFQAVTPSELIHEHIAGIPIAPNQLNLELPLVLNQIILKLMAKMPEERYQSAYGLQADLLNFQSLWIKDKSSASFQLGTQDISDHFAISGKLYGREKEVETLVSTFNRVAQGNTEVIFISGLSGMGKTTLVQEIYKPIVQQGGYFICGKFDQLQNSSPLSGLVQAFRILIQQLLTESKQKLEVWKTKILEALGENSQVLIEVLPELELLIGKHPPAPQLEPNAAQNRFNFLFQRFIQFFSHSNHPLVLFLDDLQWADFASLLLLQSMVTQTVIPYLLIIGAYRSEEVFSAHPLQLTIDEIKKAKVVLDTIILTPLKLHDLNYLIVDTLNCKSESAHLLAQLIYETSCGNPFFSIQLLKNFYQEGFIKFNWVQRSWQWDLFEIQALSPTNNVIELVAHQVQKLSPVAQEVLQIAACKGGSFSDKFLAHLLEISLIDLHASLWEALQAGLIVSNNTTYNLEYLTIPNLESQAVSFEGSLSTSLQFISDEYTFSFIHDRVQQATYSLIPEDRQKTVHLKIGYYILNTCSSLEQEENIFEIVNQLNLGIDCVHSSLERKKIARLNWIAGCKAKTSIAYMDTARYCTTGVQLLDSNGWDTEYELTLGLHYGAAEAALLMGTYQQVELLTQEIETRAKQDLDRVKGFQIRIEVHKAQGQVMAAITTGLSALNLLGIQLPQHPQQNDFQMRFSKIQWELGNRVIEDLVDLPNMTDPEQLVIMEILGQLLPITYSYNPLLSSILILKLIELSLEKGNSPLTSWGYIAYGVILWKAIGDVDIIYRFGKLGTELGHKFGIKKNLVITNFTYNIFIQYWKASLRETLSPLLKNYLLSLEVGDLVHASFSLVDYAEHSIWCGKPLIVLEQELDQFYESLINLNQEITLRFYEIYWQAIVNLIEGTLNPKELKGKVIDESVMLLHFQRAENRQAIFLLYLYKLYLCYLFCDYSEALQNAELAEAYLDSVPCRFVVVVFSFYRILVLLTTYSEKNPSEQENLLETVAQQSDRLKKWAESAPMNFLHKYYLVKAEQHRVLGQQIEAMSAYDQAITLAQENEYLNEEALAHELAGVFYLNWGKTTIAQTYLINAYYAYERWGAGAKLHDLEQRYPDLLNLFRKTESSLHSTTLKTFSEETSLSSNTNTLDWVSVTKASQALSQEIDLHRLLAIIMQVVIENAGAEHGSLLLEEEESLTLKAHCNLEGCYTDKNESIGNRIPWDQNLPKSILNYVERTQQALVLANAVTDIRFTADPYVIKCQPRSILCMPIQRQGKLVGILYLENSLTTNVFTTDRLEVLQLLTAQAAISLENARLYASVEQKVKDRTLELQIAKQEAESAKEASEKANLAKSEFLASMSHELRTPLNAVLGFSQLLHRDSSTLPEHREKLGIINRSGEHLLTLINDVLTMSKIESGRTTLNETSFDLHALLTSIHEMLSIKAESKQLIYEFECSQALPQFIQTDAGKLRQVLINLLGNAIKFTQQGTVKLRVSQNSKDENISEVCAPRQETICLCFEVEDTGPGIAPHEIKDLFTAFAQTSTGRQSQEGTGLGLPISRTFVQLMGGDIQVKSTLGQGSCFSFNIQVRLLEDALVTPQTLGNAIALEPGQSIYRILVVEDRWENQQVLIQILETVGFEVQVASNGKEAIAAWQANLPHLILMDLQMPIMDGYEATTEIRRLSAQAQLPPPAIIVVTANTFEETQLKTLDMKFDDFIHKPFQVEVLLKTIAKHLGVHYVYEASSPNIEMKLQNKPQENVETLKSEDFQQLSSEWINQVYLSASELDETKLASLIEQISQEYSEIASKLMNLLNKYRFDQIVNLIKPNLKC
jgi:predicted ATPase/signal transduction histidine kinase/serine/threonine protein kinase/DNA-binding response OmpR family regulator